ncbi:MAG TPA: hypothetical protein VFD35_10380 [Pricia sp.]|nr:hypothetical protein [Pricia sp.]
MISKAVFINIVFLFVAKMQRTFLRTMYFSSNTEQNGNAHTGTPPTGKPSLGTGALRGKKVKHAETYHIYGGRPPYRRTGQVVKIKVPGGQGFRTMDSRLSDLWHYGIAVNNKTYGAKSFTCTGIVLRPVMTVERKTGRRESRRPDVRWMPNTDMEIYSMEGLYPLVQKCYATDNILSSAARDAPSRELRDFLERSALLFKDLGDRIFVALVALGGTL